MDNITLERIKLLHPKIREEVRKLYEKVNNKMLGKGVRLRLTSTLRTPEEQDALFLKRPKVTNAKAWQSIHQYGLAFDIAILYDLNNDGVFEKLSYDMKKDGDKDGIADWLEITQIFVEAGYTNGFLTNGKKWDYPHFQKDFGMNWKTMKKLIDEGKYIEENGNKYITI
jgi:peptidoglycan L-alanyl-D-glutamate endopeptidase CwlK